MKKLLVVILIWIGFGLHDAEAQVFETDYILALDKSTKEQKPMLILFIDADIQASQNRRLKDNFLNNPDLKSLSDDYVLLEINCDSSNNSSDVAMMYCNRLIRIYNEDRQFPAVIATDKYKEVKGGLQTDFSKTKMSTYFNFLQTQ